MKHCIRNVAALLMALLMLLGALIPASAEMAISKNPLISPLPITSYTETQDEFLNIMLIGIDLSYKEKNVLTSAYKSDLMASHADALVLASINLTKNTVSLISIPRDTLVYVPGVRGVYKINNAFNCATEVNEGLMHTCDAVSRLMGGIRVDKYCAVDVEAMIALCDAIGGVDFDMEMTYKGDSSRSYKAGFQHMDGIAIFDYVRARSNSSGGNYTDIARTRRQRKMMEAIYAKLKSDPSVLSNLWAVASSGQLNFFTNLDINDVVYLVQTFAQLESTNSGSYGLEGEIKLAFGDHGWNFCFTDPENRREIIRSVYGLEVEDIPYTSFKYTEWLQKRGFAVGRYLVIGQKLLAYGRAQENATENQKLLLDQLEDAYNATVAAYDASADALDLNARDLNNAYPALRSAGEKVANSFKYMRDVKWNSSMYFFRDPLLCDYTEIDWR